MADFHHALFLPDYFLNCSPLLGVLGGGRTQKPVCGGPWLFFLPEKLGEKSQFVHGKVSTERDRSTRPGVVGVRVGDARAAPAVAAKTLGFMRPEGSGLRGRAGRLLPF